MDPMLCGGEEDEEEEASAGARKAIVGIQREEAALVS